MGLFDRVEKRLERAVSGAFAKAFRSEVQPVEIASGIRRAMDERASVMAHGRTVVPNLFTIEMATTDYQRIRDVEDDVRVELVAAAQEHAESERYAPGGPFEVYFGEDNALETGVFRVRTAVSRRSAEAEQPAGAPGSPSSVPYAGARLPADVASAGAPAGAGAAGASAATAEARPRHVPAEEYDAQPYQPRDSKPRVGPAQRPWLSVDGERYPLISALTVLGRDTAADIVLDDPGISRRHSELRVTNDGPHLVTSIRDLDSTNGTFVNGERITSRRLDNGDQITVGRTTVVFRTGKRG